MADNNTFDARSHGANVRKLYKAKMTTERPLKAVTGDPFVDSMSLDQLIARRDVSEDVMHRRAYRQRYTALSKERAKEQTEQLLKRRAMMKEARRQKRLETSTLKAEADAGDMDISPASGGETHQNVTDHTGESSDRTYVGLSLHETPDGSETQYSLDQFFERPITIHDATWASGSEVNTILKVWNLWSLDNSIRAKLSNYAYFKGTMHVKIAFTGTPYHYGRAMVSYQPYAPYNNVLANYDSLLASTVPGAAATRPLYKAYLSQAPNVAYIDFKENKPLELEIPFISHKNKFRIFNNDNLVIGAATELTDFEEAGELRIVSLNPVAVANDDFASAISVNVYAWMTDVQLGTITGTDMNITAESDRRKSGKPKKKSSKRVARDIERMAEDLEDQLSDEEDNSYSARWSRDESERRVKWDKSKEDKPMYSGKGSFGSRFMESLEKGGDEYAEPGPVANIATAVSGVGESLKDVPVIGGFAKATSTIAKSVGKVASWFGWAKPVILEDPSYVKTIPFSNGANLFGKSTAYKLTADPKQELSVDQSLGGCERDDMSILEIASRESLLTTFTWADSDAAATTVLFKSLVNPMLYEGIEYTSTGTQVVIQDTAMKFAATPFGFWRGDITFRFEVVCSKFHRGKLLIKFDPNVAQHALISSGSTKLNQQNTIIMDIQDSQELTFTVKWAYVKNWARCPRFPNDVSAPPSDLASGTAADFTAYLSDESNGWIEVRVLNELVQPTSTSDVPVNVYVKCDNLQVARPAGEHLPTSRLPIFTESQVINENSANPGKEIYLDHFGEKILSFRSLLKRYVTSYVDDVTSAITGKAFIDLNCTQYPRTGMLALSTADGRANQKHIFNYLRHGYMGVRGGFRYRVVFSTTSGVGNADVTRARIISITEPPSVDMNIGYFDLLNANDAYSNGESNFFAPIEGAVMFHPATNGGFEVEIPYYSDNLFHFAFSDDYGETEVSESRIGYQTEWGSAQWGASLSCTAASGDTAFVQLDSSSAEDFTFLRFQGAPMRAESEVIGPHYHYFGTPHLMWDPEFVRAGPKTYAQVLRAPVVELEEPEEVHDLQFVTLRWRPYRHPRVQKRGSLLLHEV